MLVLTKLTISGSGFDGLRIGSTVARRACCRSRSMSGRGVAASRRSRKRPLDLRRLRAQLAVGRLEFLRLAIRAQRFFELAGLFELPRRARRYMAAAATIARSSAIL